MNFSRLTAISAISMMAILAQDANASVAALMVASNEINKTASLQKENLKEVKNIIKEPEKATEAVGNSIPTVWGLWLDRSRYESGSSGGNKYHDFHYVNELKMQLTFPSRKECVEMHAHISKMIKETPYGKRNQCIPGKYLLNDQMSKDAGPGAKWGLWTNNARFANVELKAVFNNREDCMSVANPLFELSNRTNNINCIPGNYNRKQNGY